ncbi:MAG: gliding motility-associated C-terminal domain-containing protein [Bacteroidales bacterium]
MRRALLLPLTTLILLVTCVPLVGQNGPAGVGDMSNMQLWLRSDRDVITIGPSQVVIWQDLSGKDRDFGVVVSGQDVPSLVPGVVKGFPAVRFSDNGGVNGQFLGFTGDPGFSGSDGATVIMVARNTTPANEQNGGLFMGIRNAGSPNQVRNYSLEYADGVRINGADQIFSDGHTQDDLKMVIYQNGDGDQLQQYQAYINGNLLSSASSSAVVPATAIDWLLLGATQNDGTFDGEGYFNGDMFEVVVYTDKLTEAERIVVENSLGAKYDLPLNNDFFSFQDTHYHDVSGLASTGGTTFTNSWSGRVLNITSPAGMSEGEYLFYGSQGGSVSSWNNTEVSFPGMYRIDREWVFDETGDVGTVTVNIPAFSLPSLPACYQTLGLLVDPDGDFSDGNSLFYEATLAAGVYSVNIDPVTGTHITIAVRDITPPVAICRDITVYLDDTGNVSIVAADVDDGSYDNCGIAGMTIDNSTFDCSNTGGNNVLLTVSDGSGNSASCTSVVTVLDTIFPTLTCPAPIAAECAADIPAPHTTYALFVSDGGSASDNCGIDPGSFIHTGDVSDGNSCPETITRSYSISDVNGNSIACSQEIIVNDLTSPVMIMPPDMAAECISLIDPPYTDYAAFTAASGSAADNCAINEASFSHVSDVSDGLACPETITRTYSISDNCGNMVTGTQTIVVMDTRSPDVTGTLNDSALEGCEAADRPAPESTVAGIEALAGSLLITDNCSADADIMVASSDVISGSCPVEIVRTYTLTDECGNSTILTHRIYITDSTSPVLTLPPDFSVECAGDLPAPYADYAALTAGGGSATDGCGIDQASFRHTGDADDGLTDPKTISRTYEISDLCGNTAQAIQLIVIDDVTDPVIPVLPDISEECSVTLTPPTTTDNCAGTVTGTTSDPLTYNSEGSYLVTWSFDDGDGNVVTAPQNIHIDDITPPVPDVASLPDITGDCSVTIPSVPTATDNCAGPISATTTDPVVYNTLGTYSITWTYNDGNGNVSTQTQTVIVSDDISPLPDEDPLPDVTIQCNGTVPVIPTATDNCAGVIAGTTSDPLTYSSPGNYSVTWTYDDGNGNSVSQIQNILVQDTTEPVPDVAVLPDLTGECGVTVTLVPTATDECAGTITGTTTDPLVYTVQGVYSITWTYSDGNGNSVDQVQNVIVDDITDPVPDIAILPDLTDQCGVIVTTPPEATDNCAGTLVATTTDPLTYSSQGTFIITWVYDDGNGNSVQQTQNVIINDITQPVPDNPTLTDISEECSVTTLSAPSATDNCSGTVYGTHNVSLPVTASGLTVVTWTYDDGNGNQVTQTQNILIADITPPSLVTKDAVVEIGAGGTVTIDSSYVFDILLSGDNCGDYMVIPERTTFTCADLGDNVINVTATDLAGNSVTGTATVTVTDPSVIAVEAGPDDSLCFTDPGYAITGASVVNGTVLWGTTGDGSFNDPTLLNPVYTPGVTDSDSVKLYIDATAVVGCKIASDTLKLSLFNAPVADAGPDTEVCKGVATVDITGASYAEGSVLWTTSGDGSFDDPTIINPVYTLGSNDTDTGMVTITLTVTSDGPCDAAVDDMVVTISTIGFNVDKHSDITCNGLTDGVIEISGSGGAPPYLYSINSSPYQAGGEFTGLVAGDYLLSVMDQNGCVYDSTITIIAPDPFTYSLDNVSGITCFGENDGSVSITINGGTEPYIISWSGPDGFLSTDEDITGLSAGDYTLSLTDANNCAVYTTTETITEPPQISVTLDALSDYNGYGVSCAGSSDGSIDVSVSGGIGTLVLLWTGPDSFSSSDEDLTDLSGGVYTLTVTDDAGCSMMLDVTLAEPSPIEITYIVTDADCPDEENGAIDLTVSGGVPSYIFAWNDGFTFEDRTGVLPADYTVTVTDVNGCREQAVIPVGFTGTNCLVVYEVITPGVVDGRNDELIIRNIELYPNAEIRIFTRWGKLVFQTKNPGENRWDGTYKGNPLPVDSYHYILDTGDGRKPVTGTITIVR